MEWMKKYSATLGLERSRSGIYQEDSHGHSWISGESGTDVQI